MQKTISENFRFIEWQVYKDAKLLYRMVLDLIERMPKVHQYSIGDQLRRSGLSVVLNIAEGSGKHSDGDLKRFLSISMGSLCEVFATIDVMKDNNIITVEEFDILSDRIHGIGKQIGGFKKSIK